MTNQRHTPSATAAHPGAAKIRETVEARDALADALTRAGIQLPAMDVRTPWQDVIDSDGDSSDGDAGSAARYALVHLGVCSAPVAFALAAVIIRGAGR
ncbi:MAG: hypothetical protein ACRDP3_05520 [Streptomyces sp.]|uniref:hypothetical protein n=1 Tax=Streptomyces sp. TaxID=1931 RepID=UPI003D6A918C